MIAYRLLQRFLTVNHAALLNLTTNHDLQLDKKSTVLAGTPLTELIDVGLNDHSIAPTILSTLLSELEEQTSSVHRATIVWVLLDMLSGILCY